VFLWVKKSRHQKVKGLWLWFVGRAQNIRSFALIDENFPSRNFFTKNYKNLLTKSSFRGQLVFEAEKYTKCSIAN
jgi:hypothetical protein